MADEEVDEWIPTSGQPRQSWSPISPKSQLTAKNSRLKRRTSGAEAENALDPLPAKKTRRDAKSTASWTNASRVIQGKGHGADNIQVSTGDYVSASASAARADPASTRSQKPLLNSTPRSTPFSTSKPSRSSTGSTETTQILFQKNGIAKPLKEVFDPWNSATTGHQRGENRVGQSTGWRNLRNRKLQAQYKGGYGGNGGATVAARIGPIDPGDREPATDKGQRSIVECFKSSKTAKAAKKLSKSDAYEKALVHAGSSIAPQAKPIVQEEELDEDDVAADEFDAPSQGSDMFRGLVMYINGTTHPLISDHRLRYLINQHGGMASLHLARRRVTHVILGPGKTGSNGKCYAGGGLAAGKMQKEISQLRGAGIKFVSAKWILESVKAGKRLPEKDFVEWKMAMKGQRSVLDVFGKGKVVGIGNSSEANAK
jgi:hypothetical protein